MILLQSHLEQLNGSELELNFSKYCKYADDAYLPHQLDMPTNRSESEIHLTIEH